MRSRKSMKTKLLWLIPIALIVLLGGVMYYSIPQPKTPTTSNVMPSPAGLGEIITFSGELVCLPHKNTSGPQTMECAYGLKTPEGMYYALRDTDPTYKHISGVAMGKQVAVEGLFTPQTDIVYPTEGIIEIKRLEEH